MDKYTQVKRIGEGSFGKALLVKAKDSGKYYVIKEITIQKVSAFVGLHCYHLCIF